MAYNKAALFNETVALAAKYPHLFLRKLFY